MPELLEAIDWAIEVDEEDRPQTVDAWRQALAGGGRRQSPATSVRSPPHNQQKIQPAGRSGLSWTTLALTMAIIALLGVGAWWGWQEYPQLFGQGPDDSQQLAQQAATTDVAWRDPARNRIWGNRRSSGQDRTSPATGEGRSRTTTPQGTGAVSGRS